MKWIQTKGDNGKGCYAGIELIICERWHIPLFWPSFFAQEEAKEHDLECGKLDQVWNANPEMAWELYDYATRKFIRQCERKAGTDRVELIQTCRAEWFCNVWGNIRYGLAKARHNF